MTPDFSLLSALSGAPITAARVPSMYHVHFTDIGAWSGRVAGLSQATGATAGTPEMHGVVLDLVTAFLDTHVRGIASAFIDARARAAPAIEFATVSGGQ